MHFQISGKPDSIVRVCASTQAFAAQELQSSKSFTQKSQLLSAIDNLSYTWPCVHFWTLEIGVHYQTQLYCLCSVSVSSWSSTLQVQKAKATLTPTSVGPQKSNIGNGWTSSLSIHYWNDPTVCTVPSSTGTWPRNAYAAGEGIISERHYSLAVQFPLFNLTRSPDIDRRQQRERERASR